MVYNGCILSIDHNLSNVPTKLSVITFTKLYGTSVKDIKRGCIKHIHLFKVSQLVILFLMSTNKSNIYVIEYICSGILSEYIFI